MDYRRTVNLPQTPFPQRAGLATSEPLRLARWLDEDLYGQQLARRADAPRYELHDGPPYSNGDIHIGHALNKILKDIITRYRDLAGYRAPYRPGWDNHGLPIEYAVSQALAAEGRELDTLSLRRACRTYAQRWVDVQREQFKRLGIRGDWDHPYLTMAPEFEAGILESFATLAKAGYIYRGERIVQWAPSLRTALADAEIEYRDKVSPSIYVPFAVTQPSAALADLDALHVVIWTTTPWTIPANLAIAVRADIDYRVVEVEGRHYVLADYLADALGAKFGWAEPRRVRVVAGAELAGTVTQHPLYDRPSPVVLADYVSLEEGTGCVHTAPGHGKDDFETGRKYGLPAYCPVDEDGKFTAEAGERLAGRFVLKANDEVAGMLAEVGALLAREAITHQYPHDWRAHEPIIFRATTQWFLNIDHDLGDQTHRERALAAIDAVAWHPPEGRERIAAMVAGRPDWCVSRQRAWGMGIPAFYCPCGATILEARALDSVVEVVREHGSDAWFELPPEQLLPAGYTCPECGGPADALTKETDVLDVWFDSGSTHQCCYSKDELPVELYVEGSDQHRGWFNSSLMVSVGLDGRAPYEAVLTHGFTLDSDGRKMSKSLGNTVDPQNVVAQMGADVLRLWVASVDYSQDQRIGDEILARVADTYRGLRNSLRFLLGNLHDFDPATDSVPEAELGGLDRYLLHGLEQTKRIVTQAYEEFNFHQVVYHLHLFALEASATYLDVAKDELYCGLPWGRPRRAIQTVLYALCSELTRLLAPILCFTADEAWELLPGTASASVHLSDFPAPRPERRIDPETLYELGWLIETRDMVKAAQEAYNAGRAKGERLNPLEMAVTLTAPPEQLAVLERWADEIRALFVVSAVELRAGDSLAATIAPATGQRCARSWRIFPDAEFGHVPGHETLSDRDGAVVAALAERGLLPAD